MRDSLGDRMKKQYEDRTRFFLPRRTYTIARVDGKAFHSYTRGLRRPFDDDFIGWMNETALALCDEVQGCEFGFVQSDEISLLLTDFAKITTDAYFDGNVQKIASVTASIATREFNLRSSKPTALFDSRVFTIPDPTEVENYFIWRQQDAERNSLQSLCQAHFSAKQLHGASRGAQHELLHGIGINWNDLAPELKRGRLVSQPWAVSPAPQFTKEREVISALVPRYDQAEKSPKI